MGQGELYQKPPPVIRTCGNLTFAIPLPQAATRMRQGVSCRDCDAVNP
jgi:hypothetical protein